MKVFITDSKEKRDGYISMDMKELRKTCLSPKGSLIESITFDKNRRKDYFDFMIWSSAIGKVFLMRLK